MENQEKPIVNQEKLKQIQNSFDESMRILENQIAESITNKNKLEVIKKDLKMAKEKFIEAERYLKELKYELHEPHNDKS